MTLSTFWVAQESIEIPRSTADPRVRRVSRAAGDLHPPHAGGVAHDTDCQHTGSPDLVALSAGKFQCAGSIWNSPQGVPMRRQHRPSTTAR
jgi:hypothetical protein